jgi:hypothetical protein
MNLPIDNTEYNITMINFGYNLIVCKIDDNGNDKVIYIHKFPPSTNTTNKPNMSKISLPSELIPDTKLKKDTLINFWNDKSLYQANQDWKGGEWGSNNLSTTDNTFCSGIFIGDKAKIKIIKHGIIPYNTRKSKPFELDDSIIDCSYDNAWSCNITIYNTNITYSCYICEQALPQSAIDVLFIWENSLKKKYVKILRRGNSHPNVDMPALMMPGAGEHREPGNNISFKSDILRAVKEEIGIDNSTLSECYLVPVGTFNDDKRDPRYWTFTSKQDDEIITFGIERKSSTDVYILYIQTNVDDEPKEIDYEDNIEVNKKYWINLDNSILSNKELWMIPEHSKYFIHAKYILDNFDLMPTEYKITKKMIL